jgi:protein O-mannosyl-transferase
MKPSRHQIAVLLVLATVLAYANTLSNSFLWDDESLVVNNNFIRNNTYIEAVFTTDLAHGTASVIGYYRPLQTLSFMADYFFWGLNPFGYHLTNLLLHLVCVLLVAALVSMLTDSPLTALLVGAVFAVHPVNTGAVAYVSGRADSMAFAGMLGAFLLYLVYRNRAAAPLSVRVLLYGGSALCFVAALFSRENALQFPALIFLYGLLLDADSNLERQRFGRRFSPALSAAIPYLLLGGFFAAWRRGVLLLQEKAAVWDAGMTAVVRARIIARGLATYVGLILWPDHLQMDRRLTSGSASLDSLTAAGIVTAIVLAVAIWKTYRTSRVACFGLCWFGVTVLPMMGLLKLIATIAEHWLYVPLVGLALATVTLGLRGYTSLHATIGHRARPLAVGICVTVAALLVARTIRRNSDWADSATFCAKTRDAAPYSQRARNNLGRQFRLDGEWDRAIAELVAAEQMNPQDILAKGNLAVVFLKQGDVKHALAKNQECLALRPSDTGTLLRMAEIYDSENNLPLARHYYQRACASTHQIGPYLLYGQALLKYKCYGEALRAVDEAYQIEPGNAEVFNLLGGILNEQGWSKKAEDAFHMACQLDRHSPQGYLNLARVYTSERNWDRAIASYRSAVQIQPHDAETHCKLGLLLWRQGNPAAAELEITYALSLAPNSAAIARALDRVRRDLKTTSEQTS